MVNNIAQMPTFVRVKNINKGENNGFYVQANNINEIFTDGSISFKRFGDDGEVKIESACIDHDTMSKLNLIG